MNIPETIELLNLIENATYPTGSAAGEDEVPALPSGIHTA